MNVKTAIAFAVAAAAAVPAFADSADFAAASPSRAKVSRAEVQAEVLRARAAGELEVTEAQFPAAPLPERSTVTRAEVRAQVIRARAAGELDVTEASPGYPSK